MKVKIEFTIDVDLHRFAEEHGYSIQEARERIKELVRSAGTAELIENGFLIPGKPKTLVEVFSQMGGS